MAKGHKHLKHLRAEKAKVKLKAKKTKQLPKGLNVTDPSFKVKKIVIREQLRQKDETEILSRRKLNVKDLLSRLQHHNSTVRQEAMRELKEILSQHMSEILSSQFSSLLQGVSGSILDREKSIRRDSLKVLNLILSPISAEQLSPFFDMLISYLKCAMTHIDPYIKDDSLLFLDVLHQTCGSLLAKNSHRVLPNFLDMISRLHTEAKPGRQLTLMLNSKSTTVKWRIKVLERIATMFSSIVYYKKLENDVSLNSGVQLVHIDKCTKYIPVHNKIHCQISKIDFLVNEDAKSNTERTLDSEELVKYVSVLMPLMFDSWIEVCSENNNSDVDLVISSEAAVLLKSIVEIIQLVTECIELLNSENDADLRHWFKTNFQSASTKHLLTRFPYSKAKAIERLKKHQENFSVMELSDKCLEQNLALCQIYIWFMSADSDHNVIDKQMRKFCHSVIDYLKDVIEHWTTSDNPALPQLVKVLKTLFLKASKVLYANGIDMTEILKVVIQAYSKQPRKELQSQLFIIISDIILDHTLHNLHREKVFIEFVSSLPNLLLRPSIHNSTIQMINRVALRYREWISEQLITNQQAIIENAKTIEIIGSEDEKLSRLAICNLFYFLDGQIYY